MSGFGDPNVYQPRAPANPRLLKALAQSGTGTDAQARHGFYDALMNSVLLIPTDPATGQSPARFLLAEDDKGIPTVCVFTDLSAMQRWLPGATTFTSVPTPQFLRDNFPTSASGIWLNIADRSARFISRAELAMFTSGLIQPTYAQQVEKELAPLHHDFTPKLPSTLPDGLMHRIVEAVRREADVIQAFVMEISPDPKRTRLCVGLRLTRLLEDQVLDQLLRRIARQINVRKHHRGTIDVIILDYKKHRVVASLMPALFER